MKFGAILLSLLCCCSCAQISLRSSAAPVGTADSSSTIVPFHYLVARPELFGGKRVRTIGYMHLEFEGSALYATKQEGESRLMLNGVALEVPSQLAAGAKLLSDQYVVIEGVFHESTEREYPRSCGILQVSRIEPWPLQRLSIASRPNQSLEPTPLAVTIPASAGLAPSSVVAHL